MYRTARGGGVVKKGGRRVWGGGDGTVFGTGQFISREREKKGEKGGARGGKRGKKGKRKAGRAKRNASEEQPEKCLLVCV